MDRYLAIAMLGLEFRGYVRAVLGQEKHGQMTPERAIAAIREEFELYDATVKAEQTYHAQSDGGQ